MTAIGIHGREEPGVYRNNGDANESVGPELFSFEDWYILCNPERIYHGCTLLTDMVGFKKGDKVPCIWVSAGYYTKEENYGEEPCLIFFSSHDVDWDNGYLGRTDIEHIPAVRNFLQEKYKK